MITSNRVVSEYRHLTIDELNGLGNKGFELISVWNRGIRPRYYFVTRDTMERFEYKIIEQFSELSEGKLNALGRHGFELVSVDLSSWGCKYFFKRHLAPGEVPNPAPEKKLNTETPF